MNKGCKTLTLSAPESLIQALKETGNVSDTVRKALYQYLGWKPFFRLYSSTGTLIGTWSATHKESPLMGLRIVHPKRAYAQQKWYTGVIYYAKEENSVMTSTEDQKLFIPGKANYQWPLI